MNTVNQYAKEMMGRGESNPAIDSLMQCEQLLASGVAGAYPEFKYVTTYNIAHCYNLYAPRLTMQPGQRQAQRQVPVALA